MSRNIFGAGEDGNQRPLYKGNDMLGAGTRDAIAQSLAPVLLRNIVMVEAVYLPAAP
jgi:hypothetical protein